MQNPQQNASKQNAVVSKELIHHDQVIQTKVTRMVQPVEINIYDTTCEQRQNKYMTSTNENLIKFNTTT